MSRRGAGSTVRRMPKFEFLVVPALSRSVVELARELLDSGMTSAQVCSLFTHAACTLAQRSDGIERQEWLELCEALYDGQARTDEADGQRVTSPGGQS